PLSCPRCGEGAGARRRSCSSSFSGSGRDRPYCATSAIDSGRGARPAAARCSGAGTGVIGVILGGEAGIVATGQRVPGGRGVLGRIGRDGEGGAPIARALRPPPA